VDDFREGRMVMYGLVNVGFSAFHEGRGTGKKTAPPGVEKRPLIFSDRYRLVSEPTIGGFFLFQVTQN